MRIAELRELPNLEKLKIIETLWSDLTADIESIESPYWHATELEKTALDYKTGKIVAQDWDQAKKELRSRFE